MQQCTICNSSNPDDILQCQECGSDLQKYSATSLSLKNIQSKPRIEQVIVSVSDNACPACARVQGIYNKFEAPSLPVKGCSHPLGCRCKYQPVMEEIYP
jgi:hypothetical protein